MGLASCLTRIIFPTELCSVRDKCELYQPNDFTCQHDGENGYCGRWRELKGVK